MRVLIATDAWHPQVNGVVRTLTSLAESAKSLGVSIEFLTPKGFPSIRAADLLQLCVSRCRAAARSHGASRRRSPTPSTSRPKDRSASPARAYCRRHGLPFTTSYTTRFPEYISARAPIPESLELRGAAPLPRRRDGDDGLHPLADVGAAQPRLPESRHVDARRRHRPVRAASRDPARPAAADLPDRRPRRGREESRGVPVARSARLEGRDRRRAAGSRAARSASRTRHSSDCARARSSPD